MRVLVSACLLGIRCRYDGAEKLDGAVAALAEKYELVPVCPEQLGGLPTPREPAERRGDRVVTASGADVTEAYRRGAEETLKLCRLLGCGAAVLKERSPSCGRGRIHNGRFDGGLADGSGVTAALLLENGIAVVGETDLAAMQDGLGADVSLCGAAPGAGEEGKTP
jgi:uncharacterized protein YbbK (DUF523 family)